MNNETSQLPYTVYYENSRGETVRLDSAPFYLTGGELFDSGWSFSVCARPNSEGGRLISRRRSGSERRLELSAAAGSPKELSDALERLARVYEYDIGVMSPGRLWVCGMYLSCYVVASEKTLTPDFPSFAAVRLTVLPELPAWCGETVYSTASADGEGHGYPYGYPYRYGLRGGALEILNDGGSPSPMRIKLYGAASCPAVVVNGSRIGADVTLADGEYAVVDQLSREIYKVSQNGAKTNLFDDRIRNGKCFEFLPAGHNTVEYGGCPADVTVITVRSEPPWSN